VTGETCASPFASMTPAVVKLVISQISCLDEINSSYIAKRPFLSTTISNKRFDWLLDTGASVSCFAEELYNTLCPRQYPLKPLPPNFFVQSATGHNFTILGYVSLRHNVLNKIRVQDTLVVRDLKSKAILGMDFMEDQRVVLNTVTGEILFMDEDNSVTELSSPSPSVLLCASGLHIDPHSGAFLSCVVSQPGVLQNGCRFGSPGTRSVGRLRI
jgi:hypothetical protein